VAVAVAVAERICGIMVTREGFNPFPTRTRNAFVAVAAAVAVALLCVAAAGDGGGVERAYRRPAAHSSAAAADMTL
jgi:hypothetical protein